MIENKVFFGKDFCNFLKYTSSIIVIVISFFAGLYEDEEEENLFIIFWVIFASISTLYSYCWDLKMDWGFL